MPSSTAKLLPAILIPLFAWRVYRRFKRNVGQQPLRPRRLISGIVVFGLLSLAVIGSTYAAPHILGGYVGGLAAGCALAFVSLRLTRFETNLNGHFYTPNTYIGIGLSALLAGRILYRFGTIFLSDGYAPTGPALFQSALTLFILGLTAGYYLTYNSGVLVKGRELAGSLPTP